MKKITLLFLVLVTTLATAFAEPDAAKNRYTHTYDFRDFTALSVSHAFKVDLTFEDRYEVSIDVPDFIEPYLIVSQNGEKVRLDLERLPNDIQLKLNDANSSLMARVSVPKLTRLQLSGASKVTASGRLVLGSETLYLQLSGATELYGLVAEGRDKLDLKISGASKADFEAAFNKLDVDLSGASKLRYSGDADQLEIELSGASGAQFDGNYAETDAEISGSSKLTMTGDTKNLSLELSGATKFESLGKTARASVALSGASKAKLSVSEKLQYALSGVSTLRVKNLGSAKLSGECSRGSKIDYLK